MSEQTTMGSVTPTQINVGVESSANITADEDLIKQVAAREPTALSELYQRHVRILMRVAHKFLQNRSDAEDLIHDVFLEAWHKAENYDPSRGKVVTWLILITRSRATDRQRSLAIARRHRIFSDDTGNNEISMLMPETNAEQHLLRTALKTLPDQQQRILYLNHFKGQSCQEIAQHLELPLGTVKSRLRAGMKNIKSILNPEGEA